MARPYFPVAQGRIGGDSRAQQGTGGFGVEFFRQAQHEPVGHEDSLRIAAVCGQAILSVFVIVGLRAIVFAIHFQSGKAGLAMSAGVYHRANAYHVTRLELRNITADACHSSDDLMARNHRVGAPSPFVARLVNVGVADAAIKNVDYDIVRARVAPLKLEWRNGRCGGLRRVS